MFPQFVTMQPEDEIIICRMLFSSGKVVFVPLFFPLVSWKKKKVPLRKKKCLKIVEPNLTAFMWDSRC